MVYFVANVLLNTAINLADLWVRLYRIRVIVRIRV